MTQTEQDALVAGEHGTPHQCLGLRADGKEYVITTFQPRADAVALQWSRGGEGLPMTQVHPDGLFEIRFPKAPASKAWYFEVNSFDGHTWIVDDPYRFPLQIEDTDLYLFGEGTHYRTYEKMGAHLREIDGVRGVFFAVWAPNAQRVSVIGPFNHWDGRCHPMSRRNDSGLWELFIPDLVEGELYKFEIKGPGGYLVEKSDPYGFAAELRPRTASMVWDVHKHGWNDADWMKRRRETDWLTQPVSVYEVHPGSWKRHGGAGFLNYRDLADELIPYVVELGFTHIELMPISEHPYDGSWGYQTAGYFAVTSRFGSPDDFQYFVDRCHAENIGVIVDWVPAHFPKDEHGLAYFDGTHLYEHEDPRKGEHRDWGTLIFNYGRNEIKSFLLSNAMFLADVYHIDGLRVDAVASMLYLDYSREDGDWIPNQHGGNHNLEAVDFLKQFNIQIHDQYPGIMTFAEESTSWAKVSRPVYDGGLGFGFKWNMGWMNDTLEYFQYDPVYRKYHHHELTFSLIYAFHENFILPLSHDEVVHGKGSLLRKMPGDDAQKFANLRLLYGAMWTHPGKKLLFMGGEFGQWDEWNFDQSLDWHLCEYERHRKMAVWMSDLNALYREAPALHTIDFDWHGFEWIDAQDDQNSVVSYLRRGTDGSVLVVALNLTPVTRDGFRIGVPEAGGWRVRLNSDSDHYGGSNQGNAGALRAETTPWNSQPASMEVTLPPLGIVVYQPS